MNVVALLQAVAGSLIDNRHAHGPGRNVGAHNQSVSGINRIDLNLRQGIAQTDVQSGQPLLLAQESLVTLKKRERGPTDDQKDGHGHQQFEERKAAGSGKSEGASQNERVSWSWSHHAHLECHGRLDRIVHERDQYRDHMNSRDRRILFNHPPPLESCARRGGVVCTGRPLVCPSGKDHRV